MMLFDERMVARLDLHLRQRRLQREHGQRLLARRQHALGGIVRPAAAPLLAGAVAAAGVEAERVAHLRRKAGTVAHPELPTRPLPYRVAADFSFDLAVAHAGVVVPGGIVGAHVFEAEPVVVVEFEARSGRPEIAAGGAARMVAGAHRSFRFLGKNRVDRQATHHATVWEGRRRLTRTRRPRKRPQAAPRAVSAGQACVSAARLPIRSKRKPPASGPRQAALSNRREGPDLETKSDLHSSSPGLARRSRGAPQMAGSSPAMTNSAGSAPGSVGSAPRSPSHPCRRRAALPAGSSARASPPPSPPS